MQGISQYDTINDYEIILINDSDDFSLSENEFTSYNLKNLKIINSNNKKGYGVANNIAAQKASSEILIFMNDDIMLLPNCLEIIIDDLKMEKASAVQPKLIYPQNGKIQSTGHIFTHYTNAHAFENADRFDFFASQEQKRQALTTAVCATWKNIFFEMGMFDEIYYNAWEGMEYTLKLSHSGHICLYEPKAEAYHFRGGARNNYILNEQAQSAIFWSRWQGKIRCDLVENIKAQIKSKSNSEYLLLNFSKLTTARELIQSCDLNVSDCISYTYISGQSSVDLYKTIPSKLTSVHKSIIYFTNNFTQIVNNKIWFESRTGKQDLIIDLCGNVVYI